MATIDFVVKNGLVVTEEAQVLSTTDATASSDTAASLYTAGGAAIAKKAYIGTDLAVGNDTTLTGDLAVNGGDITTSSATFNLINATATTVNFAGAGTTINVGNTTSEQTIGIGTASTDNSTYNLATGPTADTKTKTINIGTGGVTGSTTNVNIGSGIAGSTTINSGTVVGANTTQNVFNTVATTVNAFGSAGTINLGANSGTLTIGNPTVVGTQTTQNLYNTVATTVNFAGEAQTLTIGATSGTTTIRTGLTVNGNVTLGDASGDSVTINASTISIPNTITLTEDDAANNSVSFPVTIAHTTTGTPANGIGTGIQLITETTAGNNEIGATIESIVTDVTATSEDFDFVIRQMIAGAVPAQTLKLNLNSLQVGANNTATTITTQGTANLTISTNNGTNSGTIVINNGANGNIEIAPNGTGDVYLTADTVRVGDVNTAATITTNGTSNLTINTNAGTNSGSITIANGANGNITIETNGTGDVYVNADTLRVGDNNSNATITTQGTGDLILNTNSGTNTGNITIADGVNGNITVETNGTGKVGFFTSAPVSKFVVVAQGSTVPTLAFPDPTNTRYNAGFGSGNVANIGQRLDFYAGDSGTNGTDLGTNQIRASLIPAGYFGLNNTQPNALLNVRNSRNVDNNFNVSTVASIDDATDTITFSAVHNLLTGDMIFYSVSGGSAITGLTSGFWYYVQVTSTTAVKLHNQAYSAHSIGTAVPITGTLPAGTHTFRKGVEWSIMQGSNGNGTYVHTYQYRHTDGTDWTGVGTRIHQRIDVTPQAYLEFNPAGGNYGLAFGSGNAIETFRIDGNNNIILGTGNTATSAVNRTIRMTNMSGTDVSAGKLTIQGALSTGAGTGGSIAFSTGTIGTTGSTLQTAVERMSVSTSAAATTLDLVTSMTTANVFNSGATTVNFAGAATALNLGAASGTTTIKNALDVDGNATVNGSLQVDSNTIVVGDLEVRGGDITTNQSSFNVLDGTATTVNAFGAATALRFGDTSGILTLRNPTVVGTETTVNLWNTVSTTVNAFGVATGINLGTSAAALSTLTFGPAITGNIFKIGSTSSGTINLTSDVTTGTVNLYTGVTTGTVNLATGGASTTNIGGAGAGVNIGTTGGDSTLTVRGNATTGTATLATNAATANVFNANASSVNIAGAGTAISIGASTGTVTVNNPTITQSNATSVTFNMNGPSPTIASNNTGTASVFNSNITTINFGQSANISMGSTSGTVTARGALAVNGNTTLGDAAGDVVTFTGDVANVNTTNNLSFVVDDAAYNSISYPIKLRHTVNRTQTYTGITTGAATSITGTGMTVFDVGTPVTLPNVTGVTGITAGVVYYIYNSSATSFNIATTRAGAIAGTALATTGTYTAGSQSATIYPTNGVGTGIQFITETLESSNNEIGVLLEAVTTDVTSASEDFDFVIKTMVNGASAGQSLRINNSTLTVGANSTATTITTQTSSTLTIQPGATGAAAAGNTLTVQAGTGGSTSGAGGAATFAGGNAQTSGAGGSATLRSGVSVGTNISGSNTIIEAGNGTGTGGSGTIIFRTARVGSSGAVANTMRDVLTINNTGNITFSDDVTVGGNLIVNGTFTTVNSSTLTVDDKNIELASVVTVTGLTATVTSGSAAITFISGSVTTGLLAGQTLTITSTLTGAPVINGTIQSVDSLTQVTMTALATGTTGNVVVSSSGATDATANGGGFTIKGTTDKTFQWTSTGNNFNSNQNIDINTGLTYKINNVSVLGAAAVLQNAATASIGSLAAATDVQIGANNQNNTLTVHGNSISGTATITTNVTSGIVTLMNAVTGTINLANAATTWNVGNTATATQTVSMFGASTGASTYSIFHGATANATIKTINIGTAGVSGSTTNVNIGSAVSGAVGTTTVNGNTVNLGTNQSTFATVNIGPQITGNVFKVRSPADGTGTINFTTDITTGTVAMFSSVTTGSINFGVGSSANTINLGGVGGLVNVGTITGDSTLTIRGNGTTGTASIATNVTTGTTNFFNGLTTGTLNIAGGGASTTNIGGNGANVNVGATGGNATLNVRGNSTTGTATINTNVTTGTVNFMTALTTGTMTIGSGAAGRLAIAFNQASTSTTTGAVTIAGGLGVNGAVNALTKSFIIPHPTKKGKLLKHGSLEGPEFGVYVRGRCTGEYIELPDYWSGLVDLDTITVDLTPIGKHQKLYVEKIEGLRVYIGNDAVFGKSVNCFYTVWGERKDVDKLDVEVDE